MVFSISCKGNNIPGVRHLFQDELVGHSLGGGLASAASLVNQIRATTFNMAGVHRNTVFRFGATLKGHEDLITSYRVSGEVLTSLENSTWTGIGLLMPDSLGVTYNLPLSGHGFNTINKHYMDQVFLALKDELNVAKDPSWPRPIRSKETIIDRILDSLYEYTDWENWYYGFGG